MTADALPARATRMARKLLFSKAGYLPMTMLLLAADGLLTALIVQRVPYTEIDFTTYVGQARLFLNGERTYTRLDPVGGSGPCVYPAGHIYVYALLDYLSDGARNLLPAQVFFGALYLATFVVVAQLYRLANAPPILLAFLVLSKRLHSIYVLRLFNDPVAMFVLYASVYLLCKRQWRPACILYSIKMNVLLFLPGLCVVLFRGQGAVGALFSLALIGAVQGVIGLPFLLHDAHAYAMAAFDFSRVFLFKWTVNWRFLGEALFLNPRTAKALLGVHLLLLLLFGLYTWTGLGTQGFSWIWRRWRGDRRLDLTPQYIILTLCTSNLIGVALARSLHYQFYSWYAHTLPLLVWASSLWLPLKYVTQLT